MRESTVLRCKPSEPLAALTSVGLLSRAGLNLGSPEENERAAAARETRCGVRMLRPAEVLNAGLVSVLSIVDIIARGGYEKYRALRVHHSPPYIYC